jgi:predicted metal-dependent hydrolase
MKTDQPYVFLKTKAGVLRYSLHRTDRRRTIEISINEALDVRVVAPHYASLREIQAFIEQKADWIKERLHECQHRKERIQSRQYDHGHRFLFLGNAYALDIREEDFQQVKVHFDGQKWLVRVPIAVTGEERQMMIKEKLVKWYRTQAKEIFGGRVFHYSRVMGLEPRKIAVKTQKRIWGSCHHQAKTINLNWMLVLSPLEVIDYVVVHELCHLIVADHSSRFWEKVAAIMPDYKPRQRWLKQHAVDMVLP